MLRRKLRLLKRFEIFRRQHPYLKSRERAAERFMHDAKNQKACEAAGLAKPKSFAQAMKEISSATLRQ
jgi:tetraacyldisaccharide-1-P 4'-kinase